MRHRWLPSTVKGFVKCNNCGLEVRKYMLKRGGLGPCEPDKWKIEAHVEGESALISCPACEKLVPNSIICVYCAHQLRPLDYGGEKVNG